MQGHLKKLRSLPGSLALGIAFSLVAIQIAGPLHHIFAHEIGSSLANTRADSPVSAQWRQPARNLTETEDLCLICSTLGQTRSAFVPEKTSLLPAKTRQEAVVSTRHLELTPVVRFLPSPRAPPVSV